MGIFFYCVILKIGEGFLLEKRISLLFGIIGGLFLVFLNYPPLNLSTALGSMRGYVTDFLLNILSFLGIIFIIYFSILLIVDTIKSIHKKQK